MQKWEYLFLDLGSSRLIGGSDAWVCPVSRLDDIRQVVADSGVDHAAVKEEHGHITIRGLTLAQLFTLVDGLGEQGWEAYVVSPNLESFISYGARIAFKRPLIQRNE